VAWWVFVDNDDVYASGALLEAERPAGPSTENDAGELSLAPPGRPGAGPGRSAYCRLSLGTRIRQSCAWRRQHADLREHRQHA
jgi:hypothetical protein